MSPCAARDIASSVIAFRAERDNAEPINEHRKAEAFARWVHTIVPRASATCAAVRGFSQRLKQPLSSLP